MASTPAFLPRLLLAAVCLSLPISSPAQTPESVQIEISPAQAAESRSPSTGSTDNPPASTACCGSTPAPPPVPAKPPGAQNPESEHQEQKDTDSSNVKKARWPTRSELAQSQAAAAAAAGSLPNNSFPDRPAWALSMGDRSPTDTFGQAAPQTTAPPAPSPNAPWNNHSDPPLTAANQRIVQTLMNELAAQDYSVRHHKPLLTDGVCRNDWEFVLSASGINLPAQDYLFACDPEWRKPHGLQKAFEEGDLAAADPNWIEIPPNQIESGDTFLYPSFEDFDPNVGKVQRDGHVGFAMYSPPLRRWVGVSTNVNHDPKWTAIPLEGFLTGGKPIRFFRWNGPLTNHPTP